MEKFNGIALVAFLVATIPCGHLLGMLGALKVKTALGNIVMWLFFFVVFLAYLYGMTLLFMKYVIPGFVP